MICSVILPNGVVAGGIAGINVNGAGSNISGGIDNSGDIKGTGAFSFGLHVFNTADITGGVKNQAGAAISGLSNGLRVSNDSNLSGGLENGGTIRGTDPGFSIGLHVVNTSDISGGVRNKEGATISGAKTGVRVANNSKITGGIVNEGTIRGETGIAVRSGSKVSAEQQGTVTDFLVGFLTGDFRRVVNRWATIGEREEETTPLSIANTSGATGTARG